MFSAVFIKDEDIVILLWTMFRGIIIASSEYLWQQNVLACGKVQQYDSSMCI